jgi:hypothetical protein
MRSDRLRMHACSEERRLSRVKVVYENETVDAEQIDFRLEAETVGTYALADGARVEIRHDIKNVYRLCDKKRDDGSPIYLMTGNVLLTTTPSGGGQPVQAEND